MFNNLFIQTSSFIINYLVVNGSVYEIIYDLKGNLISQILPEETEVI